SGSRCARAPERRHGARLARAGAEEPTPRRFASVLSSLDLGRNARSLSGIQRRAALSARFHVWQRRLHYVPALTAELGMRQLRRLGPGLLYGLEELVARHSRRVIGANEAHAGVGPVGAHHIRPAEERGKRL